MLNMSEEETTVLGFHDAGWSDFCRYLQAQGFKINTTTRPILDNTESIYGKHHNKAVVHQKASGKSKEPASVASALGQVKNILLSINEAESRRAIATYILCEVKMEYDLTDTEDREKFEERLNEIETSEDPNQALLDALMVETERYDVSINGLDLTGYGLVNILRLSKKIDIMLSGQDQALSNKLIEWVGYVNLETKGYEVQYPITASKRLIVDTLQSNLQNLLEGKQLIPLKMIISAKFDSGETLFMADWQRATRKMGFVFTNAEARMIYKLTKELDDPLINFLMQETVQFYEMQGTEFIETEAPWAQGNEELWLARNRSGNKLAYNKRPSEQIQDWIHELCGLSNNVTTALDIENESEQITSFFASSATGFEP